MCIYSSTRNTGSSPSQELLAGKAPSLDLQQIQSFLSLSEVQNDDVLATVISCPRERALYVTRPWRKKLGPTMVDWLVVTGI